MTQLRIIRSELRNDVWFLERKRLWGWSKIPYPSGSHKFGYICNGDADQLKEFAQCLWGITPQIVDHA